MLSNCEEEREVEEYEKGKRVGKEVVRFMYLGN